MANTQTYLASAVAGFMQRPPASFMRAAVGSVQLTDAAGNLMTDATGNAIMVPSTIGVDLLLQACNNARLYAERAIDFELSRKSVKIAAVDLYNGGSLDSAVLSSDGTTSVNVKKIITPWLGVAPQQFPIDLWTKKNWSDRVKRRYEGATPNDVWNFAYITDSPFVCVQDGNTIFIAPADSSALGQTFDVYLDTFTWLSSYVDGTENDFLLDNCFDWMMYRCIYELNYFLKEDERVQLSTKLMSDAWQAMVEWNNQLVKSTVDDFDLD